MSNPLPVLIRLAVVTSLAVTVLAASAAAPGGVRGWLVWANGDRVAGTWLGGDDRGGRFFSDRFGALTYRAGEAVFEPSANARSSATAPNAAQAVSPPLPGPMSASAAGAAAADWRPDTWSIGLAADAKTENGESEYDLLAEASARWEHDRDDVDLQGRADYKVHEGRVDNNEQAARARWFHTVQAPWLGFGQLRLERHKVAIEGLPDIDYLLAQASMGPGLQIRWGEADANRSRLVLAYNHFAVRLLDYHVTAHDNAWSLLADHHLQLSTRVTLDNTMSVYFWTDGEPPGFESETSLDYHFTEHLSLGLMHRYLRRGVTITEHSLNEFRLSTKLTF